MSEFGIKLRELRNAIGMSGIDFAHECGMSKAFYNRVEVGLAKCPHTKIPLIINTFKRHNVDIDDWELNAYELASEKIDLSDYSFNQQQFLIDMAKSKLSDQQIEAVYKMLNS